jgi:hypothetical protein
MRAGSPVPPWLRDWENLMARAVAATFWEFV